MQPTSRALHVTEPLTSLPWQPKVATIWQLAAPAAGLDMILVEEQAEAEEVALIFYSRTWT